MGTTTQQAQAAWITYRDYMIRKGYPRRGLRRREFIAGYEAATAPTEAGEPR